MEIKLSSSNTHISSYELSYLQYEISDTQQISLEENEHESIEIFLTIYKNNQRVISFWNKSHVLLKYIYQSIYDENLSDLVITLKCLTSNNQNEVAKRIELGFKNLNDYSLFKNCLSSKIKYEENSIELESIILIEDSFRCDLKKYDKFIMNSREYLKFVISRYIQEKNIRPDYYASYTALSQSSGFGKSRNCISLNNDFYVVYVCLRPPSSSGYPPRSSFASYFTEPYPDEKQLENFYIDYLNLFINKLNEDESNYKSFFEKSSDYIISENFLRDISFSEFNKKRQINVLKQVAKYERTKPLLFIFDEASNMLRVMSGYYRNKPNYFILKNALNQLKGNVFALLVDTFSFLSVFKASTSSSREWTDKEKILNPIYLLPTWDAYADYKLISNIRESILIENVCRFGRVLWASLYETYEKKKSKSEIKSDFLVKLALRKLIGGNSLINGNKRYVYTRDDYLAILSTRIGTINTKFISSNQNLVANNMAVCTFADIEDYIFEIDYPSEPILADAGAGHLAVEFEYSIEELVKCFSSSYIIEQVEIGETIAKLILIRTIDQACLNSRTSSNTSFFRLKYIQVGEFLSYLYGKCNDESKCGKINGHEWHCDGTNSNCSIKLILSQYDKNPDYGQKLLNAYMNFNHFAGVQNWMKHIDLVKAMKRCSAIQCKNQEPVIDLLIPITFNLDNFDEMSAIAVQIKHDNDPENVSYEDAFEKVRFRTFNQTQTLKPFLLIYMQLGQPKSAMVCEIKTLKQQEEMIKEYNDMSFEDANVPELLDGEIDYRSVIYSCGIAANIFPKLGKKAIDNLVKLSNTKPKLIFNRSKTQILSKVNEINQNNYSNIRDNLFKLDLDEFSS